jgi:hypothetical protein
MGLARSRPARHGFGNTPSRRFHLLPMPLLDLVFECLESRERPTRVEHV